MFQYDSGGYFLNKSQKQDLKRKSLWIAIQKIGTLASDDLQKPFNHVLVRKADSIATQVEEKIKREFGDIIEFKIRIESDDALNKRSRDFTVKPREN